MYLNTLAVGTHHVKVTFEDGIATTTLVIKEQTKDDNKRMIQHQIIKKQ